MSLISSIINCISLMTFALYLDSTIMVSDELIVYCFKRALDVVMPRLRDHASIPLSLQT